MAGELVSIPIQGGIDQSVAIALGEPRVWRLERARFVQPGEVTVSPGYAYDPNPLLINDTQHLVALGYSTIAGNWAVVSGNDGTTWSTHLIRRDPVHGWRFRNEYVSPAQAPKRHTLLTNALFNATPQMVRTTDPALVLVISNNTWLTYWRNGKIVKEMEFGVSSVPDRTKYYAAGFCFIGARGGVYRYNATTDSFSVPVSPGSATTLSVWADENFGLSGSGVQYCAVVLTTGEIYVYKWDGTSVFSTLGVIPAADIPAVSPVGAQPGLISCCFVNNLLVRFSGSGPVGTGTQMTLYVNEYGLPGLVKQFGSDVGLHSAFGGVPAQPISEINGAGVGNLWLAFQVYENTTDLVSTNIWTMNVATPALTIVRPITGRALRGRLSRAPGESLTSVTQGVLVPCQYGPTSDPASELWSVTADGAQLLTTLHGNQFYWGSTGAQPSPNAFAVVRSGLDHQETSALLIAGQSRLNNTNSPGLGTAGVRWASELVSIELGALPNNPATVTGLGLLSPGYQHSPLESYQQAGDLVSGGLPLSIGNRLDSAGCLFVPPAPTLAASSGAGLAAGTYLYVAVLEIQDSEGRVLRSSPSAPASITIVSPYFISNVIFQATPLPTISGIDANTSQWIIYRTLVNGTVFYRLGAMSNNMFVDTTSDADLQVASILYTQGSGGGISGIVPSYGVPPCRTIWKGRDRVIVGGLELPRRVRWSKLFYAGEGVAFPHPSSAQWYYDVDDDVTAVAQLDDAWLVFCRTSIYAIYGVGPDDTGANGSFDAPRCISRSFGCHSPRSLLEIPEGVLFQGQDGGVYLLTRGTLQVVWWSEKVRDLMGDVGTGLPNGWITAVIAHESKNTIHFVRDTQPPVVYDKRIQAWSLDTDWVSPGLTGAVAGCVAHLPAATQTLQNSTDENFSLFIGTVAGRIIYEGCNNGAVITTGPAGTVPWTPLLETSNISLFGLMGWGATPRISLMFGAGNCTIPSNPMVTLTLFNAPNRGDDEPDLIDVPHEFTDASQYVASSVAPKVIKSSALRMCVEWTRESFVGFVIEIDQKPRTERTQSTVRS